MTPPIQKLPTWVDAVLADYHIYSAYFERTLEEQNTIIQKIGQRLFSSFNQKDQFELGSREFIRSPKILKIFESPEVLVKRGFQPMPFETPESIKRSLQALRIFFSKKQMTQIKFAIDFGRIRFPQAKENLFILGLQQLFVSPSYAWGMCPQFFSR